MPGPYRTFGAAPVPTSTYLSASTRVVASHLRMSRVTTDAARAEVLDAARRVKSGTGGPEVESLVSRLERVTGVGIAELAKGALGWREM